MKKAACFITGIVCVLGFFYGVMWLFSSASLASGFCENSFSLFHEQFRCRQPYLATILALVSAVLSIYFVRLGKKN